MRKIERRLRGLEVELLNPRVRKSRKKLNALLSKEFQEIASDGTVYDKGQIIRALLSATPSRRAIRNFKVQVLAPGVALATFRLVRNSASGGRPVKSIRSSVWIFEAGRWKMRFHQGTLT